MSDTKPDISRLGLTPSGSDFYSRENLHATQGIRYSSQGFDSLAMSYTCQQSEGIAGGFFEMGGGMHGGMSLMNAPAEEVSPQSHHSQSSLSPSMDVHSPSSVVNSPAFASVQSPMGSVFHHSQTMSPAGSNFALSTKHMCAICGDRASGKHYGVYR